MKQITEIKKLLDEKNILEAKKKLDELDKELEKLETFFDETKAVVRNLGKSNMIDKSEIENLIDNYDWKK